MRNIKLKGAKNVRDLGGIPVEGGFIKNGKLLRGDCLDKLTSSDVLKLINEYNLKTIIDLRTTQEKREKPDIYCDKLKYIDIPIFDRRVPGITREKNAVRATRKGLDMTALYGEIVTGEYLERIGEVIRTIMTIDDGAVLFHCTAGKDRTGVVAALILAILGADGKYIYDDYLHTNRVNKKKATKQYWMISIFKGDKEEAESIRDFLLAKKEYIEAAFETIDEKWKDFDDFVKNGLKIDNKMIKKFKKNVVIEKYE